MKNAKLIEGPIGKTLLKLALPMFFGLAGVIFLSLSDAFFIGQLGSIHLAAISFIFPILLIVNGISLGLGAGASVVISRAIGRGKNDEVIRLSSDSLSLSLIIVSFFAILGILSLDFVFHSLGATQEVLILIKKYMYIWYPGSLFVVIPMVGNSIIRATGDTKTPSLIMLSSVVINLILAPILIFGLGPIPRLEIEGAALASTIARACTLAFSIWVLYKRDKMISFITPRLSDAWKSWKQVLFISIPATISNFILPGGIAIITSFVAIYGHEAVAGFGVASRIESLALTLVLALASGLEPMLGQNLGAKKFYRVKKTINTSIFFGFVIGLLLLAFFEIFSYNIALLFNSNANVIYYISLYLKIVSIGYCIQSIIFLTNSSLNVLKKPLYSTLITIFRIFVFNIPFAYFASEYFGIIGIYISAVVSNVLTGILGIFILYWQLKKEEPNYK